MARPFGQPWHNLDLGLLAVGYAVLLTLRASYALVVGWPWVLLPQALLCVGALLALRRCQPLGQPFDALVGFTLAGLAGSVAFSADPGRGAGYLAAVAGYFGLLYGLAGRWPRECSLLPVVGAAQLVLCVASLALYGSLVLLPLQEAGWPTPPPNNIYPLGHHNFVSGLLALTLPVTLVLCIRARSLARIGWGIVFLLGWGVLFTTQSRGGWLGALVGLLVAVLIGLRPGPRTRLVLAVGVPLAVAAAFVSASLSSIKPQLFLEGRDLSALQRLVFWETGVQLWRAHPLFGVGPGVTGFVFPGFRPETDPWMARTAQQLHSTPVHLLAETGLWGALAYLGWLVAALWRLRSAPAAAALAGALAGYCVASLTDFQLDNPAISLTLVLLVVELVRHRPPPAPLLQLRPLGALALVLALAYWVRVDSGMWQAEQAYTRRGDAEAFRRALEAAERIDSHQPYYPLQLAQNLLEASGRLPRSDPRHREWLLAASAAADRAARQLPTDPYTLTSAGWLHLYLSQPVTAAQYFARSLREDRTTTATLHLGMGLALVQQGRIEEALPHLRAELLLFPDQWLDERWQSGALRRLAPRVAAEVLTIYDRILERYPREHDALYLQAAIYFWQNQPQKALARLDAMPTVQTVDPNDPVALRLPWRIDPAQILGLRYLALRRLGRTVAAEGVFVELFERNATVGRCLRGTLADPTPRERFYQLPGQDYFLLRRIGGPVLKYYEPLHLKRWVALECIAYGGDARHWRLPDAEYWIALPALPRSCPTGHRSRIAACRR